MHKAGLPYSSQFLSPIVVRFQMSFQELCESKLDWDEPLSGKLLGKWLPLVANLQAGQTTSVPRCYLDGIYSTDQRKGKRHLRLIRGLHKINPRINTYVAAANAMITRGRPAVLAGRGS